jgi:hypothetical protein
MLQWPQDMKKLPKQLHLFLIALSFTIDLTLLLSHNAVALSTGACHSLLFMGYWSSNEGMMRISL